MGLFACHWSECLHSRTLWPFLCNLHPSQQKFIPGVIEWKLEGHSHSNSALEKDQNLILLGVWSRCWPRLFSLFVTQNRLGETHCWVAIKVKENTCDFPFLLLLFLARCTRSRTGCRNCLSNSFWEQICIEISYQRCYFCNIVSILLRHVWALLKWIFKYVRPRTQLRVVTKYLQSQKRLYG